MKKKLALALAAAMLVGLFAGCSSSGSGSSAGGSDASGSGDGSTSQTGDGSAAPASDLRVGVFYYNYADAYISTVRTAMDAELDALGVEYQNFDGQTNQANQMDQINTAITDGYNLLIVNIVENASPDAAQNVVDAASAQGIPVIFFNRDFDASVLQSYEDSAFVGTDPAEAGHMQGQAIGEYLVANYDAVDLNGDGEISYVMFKGQEGNPEAEYRTQYAVEDCDALLTENGKEPLEFYDPANTDKYLVDRNGTWAASASNEYMTTALSAYSEASNNMIELVICNNDGMAEGAITALNTAGYNDGTGTTIPVFGVDATDAAKDLIAAGKMTGTIKQDADGMASALATLVENAASGADVMANTDSLNVDEDCAKIRIPYGIYTGE